MQRRHLLSSAFAAAVSAAGVTQASTIDQFEGKTRPIDTMNRVKGWQPGAVEPIEIKGRSIGTGRPKLIAPTTAKTPDDLVATVKRFAAMKTLDMIEVRIDYLGRLEPKQYADVTRRAYEAAGDKIVLVTLRNGTDGGPFIAEDDYYGEVYEAVLTEGRTDIVDIELFRDAAAVGVLRHLEIQQLADTFHAYGQGQSNGYGGPGIKSLGVLQWQIRPGKGTLEQPHQVQVRDPHCRAGFLK